MDLNSLSDIQKLDKQNVLGSIQKLPDQITDVWTHFKSTQIPSSCKLAKNVVISGMGGSALGGRIADSLLVEKAKVPIEVFTEFRLPNYVNKDTLVILSSYSGNTQETLESANEAFARGATIFGITTGGKLEQWLSENSLNSYIFNPQHNPSNQPRMALGYSIFSILAVLSECGFINIVDSEIDEAVESAKKAVAEFDVSVVDNKAKQVAQSFLNKIPVLVSSEHLFGISHAFKNQLNENAKTFACLFDLPELNHHLMEGLMHPQSNKDSLQFLFFESDYYTKEVIERYPLTKEVVEKQNISSLTHRLTATKKLAQITETLVFGSYVAFYLSMLYGIDPAPIPWVDYFKEKLAS
jgi:glucose/mannose-6-phosphate isomerase